MERTMEDVVHFRLKCPRVECQAFLPFDLGSRRYGACPICGKIPDDSYIISMNHQLNHMCDPIIFAWEPSPEDLLCLHPRSKCIPQDSLLILQDHQAVSFTAGGRRAIINQANTYGLSSGSPNPDIAAIAKAIHAGGSDPALLHLHTKLVFFDTRIHHFQKTVNMTLPGGRWGISLPFRASYRLDPERIGILLEHAIDFHQGKEIQKNLEDLIGQCLCESFSAILRSVPAESLNEANTVGDVGNAILDAYKISFANAIREKQQRLLNEWGLSIVSLEPMTDQLVILDACEYVECPFPRRIEIREGKPVFDYNHICGALNLVRKGSHEPFVCKACGRKVRWCRNCNPPKYTSDHHQRMICDICLTKYTTR